jgi:hypothetical protein
MPPQITHPTPSHLVAPYSATAGPIPAPIPDQPTPHHSTLARPASAASTPAPPRSTAAPPTRPTSVHSIPTPAHFAAPRSTALEQASHRLAAARCPIAETTASQSLASPAAESTDQSKTGLPTAGLATALADQAAAKPRAAAHSTLRVAAPTQPAPQHPAARPQHRPARPSRSRSLTARLVSAGLGPVPASFTSERPRPMPPEVARAALHVGARTLPVPLHLAGRLQCRPAQRLRARCLIARPSCAGLGPVPASFTSERPRPMPPEVARAALRVGAPTRPVPHHPAGRPQRRPASARLGPVPTPPTPEPPSPMPPPITHPASSHLDLSPQPAPRDPAGQLSAKPAEPRLARPSPARLPTVRLASGQFTPATTAPTPIRGGACGPTGGAVRCR